MPSSRLAVASSPELLLHEAISPAPTRTGSAGAGGGVGGSAAPPAQGGGAPRQCDQYCRSAAKGQPLPPPRKAPGIPEPPRGKGKCGPQYVNPSLPGHLPRLYTAASGAAQPPG